MIGGMYIEGPCIGTRSDCFSTRASQNSKRVVPTYSSMWTQLLTLFLYYRAQWRSSHRVFQRCCYQAFEAAGCIRAANSTTGLKSGWRGQYRARYLDVWVERNRRRMPDIPICMICNLAEACMYMGQLSPHKNTHGGDRYFQHRSEVVNVAKYSNSAEAVFRGKCDLKCKKLSLIQFPS